LPNLEQLVRRTEAAGSEPLDSSDDHFRADVIGRHHPTVIEKSEYPSGTGNCFIVLETARPHGLDRVLLTEAYGYRSS
jgi:hypothetical protein